MKISIDDVHSWVVRCRTTADTARESLKTQDTAAQSCDRAFSEKSAGAFASFGTYLDQRRRSLDDLISSLGGKLERAAHDIAATDSNGARSIQATSGTTAGPHLNLD